MTKKGKGRGGSKGGGRRPSTGRPWEKGQSGNPKGRPKKNPDQPHTSDVVDLILAEAGKVITLNEGGKRVSMPAAEAVLKAQLVSAIQGNSHAQRAWLQQVAKAQAQKQELKDEEIAAAVTLQTELECARIEWVAKGRDEMEMVAHPTDIEIDGVTGDVKCFVIFTSEAVRARSKMIEIRDFALKVIERGKQTVAEEGDDPILKLGRDVAQGQIRFINELLPPRFRRFPTGEGPPLTLDSSPQQYWDHLTRSLTPSREDILEWLEAAGDSGWPNSGPECDASAAGPSGDTTKGADRRANSQDEEGEQS